MNSTIEKAYAKINLSLSVEGKREDGYHKLNMVMIPLLLHDSIDFSILPASIPDDFVTCDDFSLRISKYNLCHQMIDVCRERFKFKEHFNVKIHKNIWLQAGLGGGSADAAAVLRCIIKHLDLKITPEEIKEICNEVGSDILFQFYNHSAIVKERGDVIERFDHDNNCHVLLVDTKTGNSTKEVFDKSDTMELISGDVEAVKNAFINKDLKKIGESCFNSLYKPASELNPEITKLKELLDGYGFDCVSMTGSGSCMFCLSNNLKLLKKAEKELFFKGYLTEITKVLPNNHK